MVIVKCASLVMNLSWHRELGKATDKDKKICMKKEDEKMKGADIRKKKEKRGIDLARERES